MTNLEKIQNRLDNAYSMSYYKILQYKNTIRQLEKQELLLFMPEWNTDKAFEYLSMFLQRLSKKYTGQNVRAIAWTSDHDKKLSNLHDKAMAKVDRAFHEHDRNMFFTGLIEFDEIIEKIIEAYNQSQKAS
ncbi:hypothetical protein [Thermoanaerobacterium thermosaccharolyticum]|uniref:hypothetical protein n=1 Tax=Thermoanaerobacterium thermosaccharolyticum TaxID=1517 RepID=UPI001781A4C1|nr:hypothetical protein [Thermoanaerobacterium thermosaccharolyticum]MBE0069941.1 hypothetical protein [Thermoanaerobacterium thermosaccharolyticum]MBE0228069.1 hypothetical protein [Thermoanaerobacterium thermosaccharolyticum]